MWKILLLLLLIALSTAFERADSENEGQVTDFDTKWTRLLNRVAISADSENELLEEEYDLKWARRRDPGRRRRRFRRVLVEAPGADSKDELSEEEYDLKWARRRDPGRRRRRFRRALVEAPGADSKDELSEEEAVLSLFGRRRTFEEPIMIGRRTFRRRSRRRRFRRALVEALGADSKDELSEEDKEVKTAGLKDDFKKAKAGWKRLFTGGRRRRGIGGYRRRMGRQKNLKNWGFRHALDSDSEEFDETF